VILATTPLPRQLARRRFPAGRGGELARRLRAGMVHVNDATPQDEASAPVGGIGQSGLGGRSGGDGSTRHRQFLPGRSDVAVAHLLLLVGRDFDGARERRKRQREGRPVWPRLYGDGAVVRIRDAADDG
jgi:hypothetical protein